MSWQQASTESALADLEAPFRLAKPVRPSQLFDALLAAASDAAPEPETVGASTGTVGDGPYRRTRILLAEDNRINELVACKVLARGGYRCDTVDDGASAVAAVKGGDYDVVLMDCQMPNVDGFAATRAIRAWEAEKGRSRVHIIALTANAMKGDRDRCLEAGMDDYVSKPLKPALLLEKIDALARRSEGPAAAADTACLARLRTEVAAGAQERAHAAARELGALCEALEADELRRTLGELVALIGDERLDDARAAVDALERELARLRTGARRRG
jgi:CheY-like chemotaxis protein